MGLYEMVNLLPRCDKNDHFIGSNSLVVYYLFIWWGNCPQWGAVLEPGVEFKYQYSISFIQHSILYVYPVNDSQTLRFARVWRNSSAM